MAVILEMQDYASPQLQAFNAQVQQTAGQVNTSGANMNVSMGGVSDTLTKNRAAFRELAMGVNYLGTTFLGLGIAMKSANNEAIQNVGNTVMMAGAMMTAVGSAAQFLRAIGGMITALKALRVQQILSQAFAGPIGWGALAVGAGVAATAIYATSRMERGGQQPMNALPRAERGGGQVNNYTVNQNIAGSVVTERQLADNVQRGLLLKAQRNSTTGIR